MWRFVPSRPRHPPASSSQPTRTRCARPVPDRPRPPLHGLPFCADPRGLPGRPARQSSPHRLSASPVKPPAVGTPDVGWLNKRGGLTARATTGRSSPSFPACGLGPDLTLGRHPWPWVEPARISNQQHLAFPRENTAAAEQEVKPQPALEAARSEPLPVQRSTLEPSAAEIWGDGGGGSLISPRDVTMSCYAEITYTCGVSGDTEESPAASETCKRCYRPQAHGGMFREINRTRRMCLSLKRGGRRERTES